MVFQQYALFPWLTVKKNVMFALEMKRREGQAGSGKKAMKYLAMVDLEKFADHYPKELSGGMKQQVAIARAYAAEPGGAADGRALRRAGRAEPDPTAK